MIDPHVRFSNWLAAGANGEPPRDAALHASVCAECAASVAAHDALAGIDPAAAPIPPPRVAVEDAATLGRAGAVAAGLGALAVGAMVGFLLLGRFGTPSPAAVSDSPAPAEAVLGGIVSAKPSPTATVRPTRSPTPSPSPTPTPEAEAAAEPDATTAAEPAPGGAAAPPPLPPLADPTPPPTTPAPAATASPTPSPTAAPTPPPTPSPTVSPTPSPSEAAPTPDGTCTNGEDDDADGLTDALDPGCVVGVSEFDA